MVDSTLATRYNGLFYRGLLNPLLSAMPIAMSSTEQPILLSDALPQHTPGEILPLCWRIHLLKRAPKRLPVVLLVLGIGATCVWLMFGYALPVATALLLLIGSVSEYLFPVTYRLTEEDVCQESLTSRNQLPWKNVRRCRMGRNALLLTSLPVPSRLDAFRGIVLRFAPEGQPGDRASICAVLARCAPHILPDSHSHDVSSNASKQDFETGGAAAHLCRENSQP